MYTNNLVIVSCFEINMELISVEIMNHDFEIAYYVKKLLVILLTVELLNIESISCLCIYVSKLFH